MINFYKNTWCGSFDGTDEELSLLLSRCTDIVNNAIAFSGYTVDTVPDIFKARVSKAVCAHADYIDNNGGIDSLTDNSYNSVPWVNSAIQLIPPAIKITAQLLCALWRRDILHLQDCFTEV